MYWQGHLTPADLSALIPPKEGYFPAVSVYQSALNPFSWGLCLEAAVYKTLHTSHSHNQENDDSS